MPKIDMQIAYTTHALIHYPSTMVYSLLTTNDRRNIKLWKYTVEDHSITTILYTPFWNWIMQFISYNVAPNVITLFGFICVVLAYGLVTTATTDTVKINSFLAALLTFIYMTADAIDGKHARRIHNSSPLGEIMDHMCDNLAVPFLILTLTKTLGITDSVAIWSCVLTAEFLFLSAHFVAYRDEFIKFDPFAGPGEFLTAQTLVLLGRLATDYSWFVSYTYYLAYGLSCVSFLYLIFVWDTIAPHNIWRRNFFDVKNLDKSLQILRWQLIICPIISFFILPHGDFAVITSGCAIAITTSAIIIAKMTRSVTINLIVSIMAPIGTLFGGWCAVSLSMIYHTWILNDIMKTLDIPFLTVW